MMRTEKVKALVGRVIDRRMKSIESDTQLSRLNIEIVFGKKTKEPVRVNCDLHSEADLTTEEA